MIRSMTGFGRAAGHFSECDWTVEVKSVNHRFLDINLKADEKLGFLEPEIKKQARQLLKRGHVDIAITRRSGPVRERRSIDLQQVSQYYKELKTLHLKLGIRSAPDPASLLALPGSIQVRHDAPLSGKRDAAGVLALLKKALLSLAKVRLKEGKHLAKEIGAHLSIMASLAGSMGREIPSEFTQLAARFRARLEQQLSGRPLEPAARETATIQETSRFMEKNDVTEELARLNAHFARMGALLSDGEGQGRQMDFLCQEIHREINTMGVKLNGLKFTKNILDVE